MKLDGKRLPNGWALCIVHDVVSPDVAHSPPAGDRDFTYIDISSIDNSSKQIADPKTIKTSEAPTRARQHVRTGDVLVSMTRPNLNAVALVPPTLDQAVASTGFCVVRTNSIEPRWLFYLVQSQDFVREMSELVQGVMYPAVRPKDILSFEMPLAPLPEQHRIVAEIEKHLTRLDVAAASLKLAQAKLKRYRAAVLQAACEGRLVPTEADIAHAEGRDYEPADLLLERILKERRARWEDAELEKMRANGKEPKDDRWKAKYAKPLAAEAEGLPGLPEGWVWGTVEQLTADMQNGLYKPTSAYGSGIPIIRIDDFQDGAVPTREELKKVLVDEKEEGKYELAGGDLLVNRVNSPSHLGKSLVVTEAHLPALFESNMMRLRLVGPRDGEWIAMVTRSQDGRARLTRDAKWAVNQASINQQDVASTYIPIPPTDEQRRILLEVERRLSLTQQLSAALLHCVKRAERLRQAILKAALEGMLVSQDPDDEPADALLERIRAESTQQTSPSSRRSRRSRSAEAKAAQMHLEEARSE